MRFRASTALGGAAVTAPLQSPSADAVRRPGKLGSRELLKRAAADAFCAAGYFTVSVEDIASAAGVSRMTFYRYFIGTAELAAEMLRENSVASTPLMMSIAQHRPLDHTIIAAWIGRIFEANRASGQLLRVFIQAASDEPAFADSAQGFLARLITGLGQTIPAFALNPDSDTDRSRWLEAWLLLYEILDQSNYAARGLGVASDPRTIGVLADRFLRFVHTGDAAGQGSGALIYDNAMDDARCN